MQDYFKFKTGVFALKLRESVDIKLAVVRRNSQDEGIAPGILEDRFSDLPERLYRVMDFDAAENTYRGGIWFAGLLNNRYFVNFDRRDAEEGRHESRDNDGKGSESYQSLLYGASLSFQHKIPKELKKDEICFEFDAKELFKTLSSFEENLEYDAHQFIQLISPEAIKCLHRYLNLDDHDAGKQLKEDFGFSEKVLEDFRKEDFKLDARTIELIPDYTRMYKELKEKNGGLKCYLRFLGNYTIPYFSHSDKSNLFSGGVVRALGKREKYKDENEVRFYWQLPEIQVNDSGGVIDYRFIRYIKLKFKEDLIKKCVKKCIFPVPNDFRVPPGIF